MSKTSIALLILLAFNCQAANYYVNPEGGSDASNGTSTATPWQHCPGDTNATGTAASATLSAGDSVIFKGATRYTNTINLNWSGTAGNPIIYDGNSAGTWGTGRAVITDNYAVAPVGGHNIIEASGARNWITFRSLDFYAIGGTASLPTDMGSAVPANRGVGIYFPNGCNGVTVRDCLFHEIGYWFNAKPMDDAAVNGNAIRVINASNMTITNCDFSKVSSGCEMNFSTLLTNVTIANCKFHDYIRWCVDLASTSTGAVLNGVHIQGNEFYNYQQLDDGFWTGYGTFPHSDGIFYRTDFDYCTLTNLNVFNNLFWSTNTVASGTASIYITEGGSANVYNNVFNLSKKGNRIIYLFNGPFSHAPPQVVNIFNNTFLEEYVAFIDIEDQGTGRPVQTVNVENNSFYDLKTGSSNNRIVYIISTNTAAYHFDYNLYKSFNTLGEFFFVNSTVGGTNTAQSSFGWETNGIVTDPVYSSIAGGIGAYVGLNNLHLQSSSPCIGTATNLSAFFTTDSIGTTRAPFWDIGAYQYLPPIILRISGETRFTGSIQIQ